MVDVMEIQAGFKQTDVGIIPIDWQTQNLYKISDFENGKAHEQFIDDKGDYIVVNSKFISTEGEVKKFSKKNLSPLLKGNIAIVMSDIPNGKALAKCFLVERDNLYTLNQRIGCIKPYEDIDNDYLFYKLNRNKYFLAFDSGSGQTNLKKNEILDCPVAFPPTKAEQTAIATALNDADALITQLEKLIAKKRAIKQGAMQELLNGMRRLPNFSDDWITIALGDVGIFKTSSVDKVIVPGEKEVYLLNYMDVYKNSVINKTIITSKTSANNNELQNFNLKRGDIVFTPSSETPDDIGHSAVINEDLPNTLFSYHIVRYRFYDNEFMSHDFKRYVLNNKTVLDYFSQRATGSTRFVLTRKDFNETVVRIPESYEEQTRIAQILSEMDAEIEALKKKLDKHKMLKQGMMQNLLTGRIRLV